MNYHWYKIINLDDFNAMDVPSTEVEVILDGIGLKTILVTSGVNTSILYDGVFLSVSLNDRNPYAFDGHAVYLDLNDDIWLGIEIEE